MTLRTCFLLGPLVAFFFAGTSFSGETSKAISIGDHVRVRDTPSLSGKVVGTLMKGQTVAVVRKSSFTAEVNGMSDHWYEVLVPPRVKGWAYGGFLKKTLTEVLAVQDRWAPLGLVRLLPGHYIVKSSGMDVIGLALIGGVTMQDAAAEDDDRGGRLFADLTGLFPQESNHNLPLSELVSPVQCGKGMPGHSQRQALSYFMVLDADTGNLVEFSGDSDEGWQAGAMGGGLAAEKMRDVKACRKEVESFADSFPLDSIIIGPHVPKPLILSGNSGLSDVFNEADMVLGGPYDENTQVAHVPEGDKSYSSWIRYWELVPKKGVDISGLTVEWRVQGVIGCSDAGPSAQAWDWETPYSAWQPLHREGRRFRPTPELLKQLVGPIAFDEPLLKVLFNDGWRARFEKAFPKGANGFAVSECSPSFGADEFQIRRGSKILKHVRILRAFGC